MSGVVVCLVVGRCRSVCDLWPGLNTSALAGSSKFAPLSMPPLRNVSMVFSSLDDMHDYITSEAYGTSASVPPVFAAVELVSGDNTIPAWRYSIHQNLTVIPDTGTLQVPYVMSDNLDEDTSRYMYTETIDAVGHRCVAAMPRLCVCTERAGNTV